MIPSFQLYTQFRLFLKATLNLHDISPSLANTKSSIISMPGLHDVRSSITFPIHSMLHSVVLDQSFDN
jgi:hypothetical protein